MKLEKLNIVLARRTPWQAIDLGLQVARAHYTKLLAISLSVVLALSILLLSITQSLYYAPLLVWWFKPIIERPLLYYMSRAVFDDSPSLADTFKQLPSLLRTQWLKTYTLRRINPSRSFNDAVVLLEGLNSEARSRRLQTLHKENTGAIWLTMLGVHIELLLEITFFMTPLLLIPENILTFTWQEVFSDESLFAEAYWMLIECAVIAMIAPFYVSCGFILYLNRRTQLEGWDIELGLKRIAQRLQNQSSHQENPSAAQKKSGSSVNKGVVSSLVALLIFSTIISNPTPVIAQESTLEDILQVEESELFPLEADVPSYPASDSEDAVRTRKLLRELLDSDLFGKTVEKTDYSLDWFNWDWEVEDPEPTEFPWLSIVKDFASVIKYIMIIALAGLVLYVLGKYRVWEFISVLKPTESKKPENVLGLDVRKDSLPKNVINQIEHHIKKREFRQALSLMFRVHLITAIHAHKVPFKSSSTERECVQILKQFRPADEAECFNHLTQQWLLLAYAHQPPNVQKIESLFQDWQVFVKEDIQP